MEILLKANTCCNLSTNNLVAFVKDGKLDKKALKDVLRLSTRVALRMTLVDVELPNWDKAMKEDRVIGVSLTGMMDMMNLTGMDYKALGELLQELRDTVHEEGRRYAKALNVSTPKLMTTVKPEGSISTLPGVSSGVHFSHSPYYIRRVRINETDPLYKTIKKDNCYPIYDEPTNPHVKVVEFPIQAPEGKTKYDVGAIEQLELYKLTMNNWTDHNTSITVHVRENEWDDVANWVHENFDDIVGVTFLPLYEETYPLLPFEKTTKEDYEKRLKQIKPIDLTYLHDLEKDIYQEQDILDNECAGGACPVR